MKKNIRFYILISILFLVPFFFQGCIDDSSVKYNEYSFTRIVPPVDRQGASLEKKVHIGHDLPVNVTMTAKYPEDNVPVQFYLLNVDDVEEVVGGVGSISDIRMYYCNRTDQTTIGHIDAGTNSYGLIINIPSEDAKDELTGDWKVGKFYVVAEVNKFEEAEIDAYKVYQKFKNKLDEENTIAITSDYMRKPDLSVESMNFTGGKDDPNDVIVFYNLVLNNLPGGENLPIIFTSPGEADRTFTGTIHVKSSASDALNVPIRFYLIDKDAPDTTIQIPLDIYDRDMGGYVNKYYIPLLKANTIERISLGLRIPDDVDNYWLMDANYNNWPGPNVANYPVSSIRHSIPKEGYGSHNFKIMAEVNPGGEITESRFISPNGNAAYTEADYYENGDEYSKSSTSPVITKANNIKSENILIALDRIEVKPNQGIKVYPYEELSSPTEDDKVLVIYWDGISLNVGDNDFGATAQAHEGMFFYNYSLYSLGVDVHGAIFGWNLYLVNTYLNAESHPYNAGKSGFEFHIEGGMQTVLSESGSGFSNESWQLPILLWSKEVEKEQWYYCFKFKLIAGIETYFTPGIDVSLKNDGSLSVDKYASLRASVYADASASIAGLATVGLYTYLDVLTLELIQHSYTETQYDPINFPGMVMGSLNRNVGLYLIGPKGYIDLYFEIDFFFFSKRWSKTIFSFSSFRIPIFEEDFLGSGKSTTWIKVEDANKLDYNTPDGKK